MLAQAPCTHTFICTSTCTQWKACRTEAHLTAELCSASQPRTMSDLCEASRKSGYASVHCSVRARAHTHTHTHTHTHRGTSKAWHRVLFRLTREHCASTAEAADMRCLACRSLRQGPLSSGWRHACLTQSSMWSCSASWQSARSHCALQHRLSGSCTRPSKSHINAHTVAALRAVLADAGAQLPAALDACFQLASCASKPP